MLRLGRALGGNWFRLAPSPRDWPSICRSGETGGAEGIRTPDLYSAIVALSQLSYSPARQQDRSLAEARSTVKFARGRAACACAAQPVTRRVPTQWINVLDTH